MKRAEAISYCGKKIWINTLIYLAGLAAVLVSLLFDKIFLVVIFGIITLANLGCVFFWTFIRKNILTDLEE